VRDAAGERAKEAALAMTKRLPPEVGHGPREAVKNRAERARQRRWHPVKTQTRGVAVVENAVDIARSTEDVFEYFRAPRALGRVGVPGSLWLDGKDVARAVRE
jgi:hypothetical protein